ncbi:PAAR domain-containing protein [Agarivorans gilvus]|uniref:Type VI secretion protein n=1 Tax=Agarivorans gilvus TaxID=680279 RepID=A0ABQ1I8V4_9ALTE|nr:PAAR domain-containing protein [Agarivorans gilvus]GGB20072.1 type VI secretion protein [Agarivorans gilvus]
MGKPVAMLGSFHVCPKVQNKVPHVGGPVAGGNGSVTVGGMPVACVGDKLVCIGPPDTIKAGSSSVTVGGKAVARLGDPTAHGGKIVVGNPTVLIG